MEWIGDLERVFATSLYPLRVPIAIGLLVGLVALVWIGRRRGWAAVARRHPRRTLGAVLVLLVVGLPIGWYLGSPLFIRTSLVEPAPGGAPASPIASVAPVVTAAPVATPDPTASDESQSAGTRTGSFTGADEFHFGSGMASLIETSPGTWIVRFEAFSVRNGPDLFVYLSPDPAGYADGAVELGTLKATDGSFNTDVPPGIDVAAMRSVVIWCKQFAVEFAVAPLA